MSFPRLETPRLTLKELKNEHAEELFQILSLHEVMKFYGSEELMTTSEAVSWIERFRVIYEGNTGIRFGIFEKNTMKLIGTIGLNGLNMRNQRAEIGYELHPNYWNQGLMTEALQEILRYSFETLELHRIGAIVFPENKGSINLLRKNGFQNEGILRGYMKQYNKFHDTIVFSILKDEWNEVQTF